MNRKRNMRWALGGLVAAVAALSAPAASMASTMAVSSGALSYTGAATEANHLRIWFEPTYGVYVVEDTGVSAITLTSSPRYGCHSYTAQIAYCDYGTVSSVTAHLGNGGSFAEDDLALTPVTMYAGTGNDTLIGGGGNVTLVGGSGTDTLTAGSGATRLVAGSGNTTMNGGSGHDTYEGAAGVDTINARNGVAEDVSCGAGADSVQADTSDTVAGDCESVDRGVAPTTGDSTPSVPSGANEPTLPGGITGLQPGFVAPTPTVSSAPVTVSSGGQVPVTLDCPAAAVGGCEGTVTLSLAGAGSSKKVVAARRVKRHVLGRSNRFRIAAGHKAVVRVRLSRRTIRKLRRRHPHGRIRLRVTVAMKTDAGVRRSASTIVVRLARRQARPTRKPRH